MNLQHVFRWSRSCPCRIIEDLYINTLKRCLRQLALKHSPPAHPKQQRYPHAAEGDARFFFPKGGEDFHWTWGSTSDHQRGMSIHNCDGPLGIVFKFVSHVHHGLLGNPPVIDHFSIQTSIDIGFSS